jgi:ABC-type bacteriocin/lantibiotic exporter with double-glycine peptidase domain
MGILTPFFAFLKKYVLYEVLMLVMILVATVCSLASPYVLGIIIDNVIPAADKTLLLELVLMIVGLNILRFFTGMYSDYLNTWLAGKIFTDIKQVLFSNLMEMPYPYFEKNKPGEVIQVISQEVDKILRFLTTGVIRFITNLFTLLTLAALLCYLNFKLFYITLIVSPIIIFLNAKISKHVRQLVKSTGIKEGNLYNFYFERIKNIVLVKLFNTYDYERSQLTTQTEEINQLSLKNTKLTSLGNNGSLFFISLSPLLILLVGGYDVINQVMSIGALVAFIQYNNRLVAPSNDFLNLYIEYVRAHESAKRILPYLQPEATEQRDYVEIAAVNNIICSNLGITIGDTQILNNVDIEFVKGQSYGIVGANGAGKSTLIKLISKLYQPTSGSIKINRKHSLDNIDKKDWYKYLTVVSQNAYIFHESIRENLMYVNRAVKDAELWDILEAVNLKTWVKSLPKGLDTLIGDGEDCANPSGGQLQKLSLARVFIRGADVIILDEVTSSMDDNSRKEIMDIILKSFRDKIVIAISHDISDVMMFDQVILLEHGSVVESGNHMELVQADGKYKRLFKHQLATAG